MCSVTKINFIKGKENEANIIAYLSFFSTLDHDNGPTNCSIVTNYECMTLVGLFSAFSYLMQPNLTSANVAYQM